MADRPLMENLAIAQAIYKAVGAAVDTKKPDNLRGQADAQVMHLYEMSKQMGMAPKSIDLSVNGQKVGTMSVTEKQGTTKTVFDLTNVDNFTAWLAEFDQHDAIVQYVLDHGEDFCSWFVSETGEIPPGVDLRYVETPPKVGTSLRVDPRKVAHALETEHELPGVLAGLLEGAK